MSAIKARIRVVDDEDSLRWVLEKGLRQAGYEVAAVKDGTAALKSFEAEQFDLVFLDVRMPGVDGLTALGRLREIRPDACVVVMTAHGTMDTAIQAMQRGAYDYLAKPFDLDEVLLLAERALAAPRLTQEVTRLKSGLQEVWEFGAIIGRHPRMQDVYKTIGRVAGSDVTVLLRRESGTGQELGGRRAAPARGVGHGKGAGGQRDSSLQPPRRPAVRGRLVRGHSVHAPRVGD